jgi:hypothetical protein
LLSPRAAAKFNLTVTFGSTAEAAIKVAIEEFKITDPVVRARLIAQRRD